MLGVFASVLFGCLGAFAVRSCQADGNIVLVCIRIKPGFVFQAC